MTTNDALALAVALARARLEPEPEPGDLVVERSTWRRRVDPDAIGWLVSHGSAPYRDSRFIAPNEPMREVWDVTPLSGASGLNGKPYQRWENAEFLKVPDWAVKCLGLAPPDGWYSDFALLL